MPSAKQVLIVLLALAVLGAAGGIGYVKVTGLRGQPTPTAFEARLARAVRAMAVPGEIKSLSTPIAPSEDGFGRGLKHFARYCAVCHANNGSGEKTPLGQGLFPKPPDMRTAETQQLSDGELFYIIENGVRFTGMPAFGTGTADPKGETLVWQLVEFIRRLPNLTQADLDRMAELNPL